MSSLGQYILDKTLTTYDLVAIQVSLVEKPTDIISREGMHVIIGDVGYSVELSLKNFKGKEIKRKPEGIEPYLTHFKNLDALNIGYFRRSGNILTRYFFLETEIMREAKRLINEFKKLGKSYKLKPIFITFDNKENAMNVHVPLKPGIEFLTRMEERLDVRVKK